nr:MULTISPECIES: dihydrofolate reductase family protein [Staphylococcus]
MTIKVKGLLDVRHLVVFLHASLDGFVEGPNGAMDIGWIAYNEELEQFADKVLSSADTVVWGRKTYEMMHDYWPSVKTETTASEHERNHAQWIEQVEKVVFSTTLESVDWNNTRLVNDGVEAAIADLKQQPGGDIVVIGSPRFAHHLMQLNVVDTFKITVSPVLVGQGLRLFEHIADQTNLTLSHSQTFESGALGLWYQKLT